MANMEGPLSKWTNMMQGWQYRWFVLDDNAGLLSYYTSREKMTRGVRRGCIRLKGAVVGIDDEDDTTFTVTVDGKVFHLQSKDPEERERWIRALEDTILRHAQLQRKLDPSRPAPTMHDFDQKLAESDAYLQILIDQIKNLELRIENTSDETSKAKLCNIKDHANATLECIKHSIVLLQIAKNTTQPFNGVQIASAISLKPPSAAGEAARLLRLPEGHKVSADVDSVITVMDSLPVQTGIEVASECLESRTLPLDQNDRAPERSVSSSGFPSRGSLANSIPVTSYSSSEDEDFFDAYEHMGQSPIVPNSHLTFEQSAEYLEPMSLSVEGEKTSGAAAVDYDELYEMDDENDFGSMESHGSVISHLLSQVKIGMDLTKVVLPTFILERRSLLEMYADFFAHPDIFTSITDFSEPRDRMVQVVRWYLSAFHAGRKSEVAKKPYNPILGETFRCWWDVEKSQTKNNEKVSDGPIPWCSREQLTFVAEQVSHHPPVSAFYAEHVEKRISFCAHIWTKSKFLGLSVGVHHIGQGCISLHDYDEEYIVTFPNAYGRSILTVPWVELGGSVNISCAKTGYNANVEFLTKPFYGGKKNRIKADIFQPGERKPFLVVEGEWNGAMTGKWSDGATEAFVDVNALKINRKLVQAIAEQNEYESRRLWREVTAGLAFNDIPRATAAKSFLENRQREEARLRKEQNVDWKTKLFHLVGENWIYNSPLTKRLVLKKPES